MRNLTLEEVRAAISWADEEGWEPGLSDAEPFVAADPDGFFGEVLDSEVVATVSAVRASPQVVFGGFYIVRPDLRGQGYGLSLFEEVFSRFADITVGGDAVPEQLPNYESVGFVPAFRTARYVTEALSSDEAAGSLMPATDVDFDSIVAFDAEHWFGSRPDFLALWIQGDGRDSLISLDSEGGINGFAASRKTGLGHRIGPVFAEDPIVARGLITSLASRVGGRVAIDIPLVNTAGVELAESLGMTPSFETARVYRGPAPTLPMERIFGLTTLELG